MSLQIETQPFQFNNSITSLSSATFKSVSAVSLSGTFYGDGSKLSGISSYNGTDIKAISGNWQSTYNTVSSLSANWNTAYASTTALATTYSKLSSQAYTFNPSTSSIISTCGNNTSSGCYNNIFGGRNNINVCGCYNTIGTSNSSTISANSGYCLDGGSAVFGTPACIFNNNIINNGCCNSIRAKATASAYYLGYPICSYAPIPGCSIVTNNIIAGGNKNTIAPNCCYQSSGGYGTCYTNTGTVPVQYNFIANGCNNCITGNYSSILGGCNNSVLHNNSYVLGSGITTTANNTVFVNNMCISGNYYGPGVVYVFGDSLCNILPCYSGGNSISYSSCSTGSGYSAGCVGLNNINGGACNRITGYFNSSRCEWIGDYNNIGGGYNNTVQCANFSNVAGGVSNCACANGSNIAGGGGNKASGIYSNVAGGCCNTASVQYSNVAGGLCNTASGYNSNVAGGFRNTASGNYSSILGGCSNNTRGFANTFILGSSLNASQANYTYVNNLSSQGNISSNTGTFTGIISSTYAGAADSTLIFSGGNTKGGAGYNDFAKVYNPAGGKNLYFRTDSAGSLQIINSAYNQNLLTLTQTGNLVPFGGSIAVSSNSDGLSGTIQLGNNNSQIYDDGNFHIHSRGSGNSMWINTNGSQLNLLTQIPVVGGALGTGVAIGTGTLNGFVSINSSRSASITTPYGYLISTGAGSGGTSPNPYSLTCSSRILATEVDATSDERLKENIEDIDLEDALTFVRSVSGVTFNWKDPEIVGKKSGFIAQQVMKAGFEHLVNVVPDPSVEEVIDDDTFVSPASAAFVMNYDQVTPYLATAIKHLLNRIDQLEATVETLKNK